MIISREPALRRNGARVVAVSSRGHRIAGIDFDAFDAEGRPVIDPSRGMKTPEQGAATALWGATSPLLEGRGGVYCEDCDVAEVNHAQVGRKGVAPWGLDDKAAERLWQISAQWTGCDLIG